MKYLEEKKLNGLRRKRSTRGISTCLSEKSTRSSHLFVEMAVVTLEVSKAFDRV